MKTDIYRGKQPFNDIVIKDATQTSLDSVEEKVVASDTYFGVRCFHYIEKDIDLVVDNNLEELVQEVLPDIYESGTRCRFIYKSLFKPYSNNNEVCFDLVGRIGRSTGRIKVPLLIHNKRARYGPELNINNLVRIIESKKPHNVIWEYKTKTQ